MIFCGAENLHCFGVEVPGDWGEHGSSFVSVTFLVDFTTLLLDFEPGSLDLVTLPLDIAVLSLDFV